MNSPATEDSWRSLVAGQTPPPVLLAADEPASRARLGTLLRGLGHEVTEVNDGAAVLAALEQRHYPVLIADLHLKDEQGKALCAEIRGRSFGGYVHLVLVGEPAAIAEGGLADCADEVLAKPFHEAEVRSRLNSLRRILALESLLRQARAAAERSAITDALTATYNRRYLMQELPGEVERSRRFGRPLSVVMCDIDHLKQINDTHGHQVGDEVLREFAQHLASGTRAGVDWCARYGGEEFVLVLPETDAEGALNLAEKLRAGVDQLLVRAPHGERVQFTASFGVAGGRFGTEAPDAPILIARADIALYQSKQEGRNTVTLRG